jgi:hypothetical protein
MRNGIIIFIGLIKGHNNALEALLLVMSHGGKKPF